MKEKETYSRIYECPLGYLEITASEKGIASILYRDIKPEGNEVTNEFIEVCIIQIEEYFAGRRKVFTVPIIPEGTDFQKRVWNELLNIPYGETISYLELSHRISNTKAIRAVGFANGKNPVNIIIPCHRVIGLDGGLTGYGGGLWRKKWLLEHEEKFSDGEKQLNIF